MLLVSRLSDQTVPGFSAHQCSPLHLICRSNVTLVSHPILIFTLANLRLVFVSVMTPLQRPVGGCCGCFANFPAYIMVSSAWTMSWLQDGSNTPLERVLKTTASICRLTAYLKCASSPILPVWNLQWATIYMQSDEFQSGLVQSLILKEQNVYWTELCVDVEGKSGNAALLWCPTEKVLET